MCHSSIVVSSKLQGEDCNISRAMIAPVRLRMPRVVKVLIACSCALRKSGEIYQNRGDSSYSLFLLPRTQF